MSLPITTAVTCPTIRIHPAVIAQAAATAAVQTQGRFVLGVGTGEALNEHVLGDSWPSAGVRMEMLEEAVELIRLLHQGESVSFHGKHYEVQDARIYTLPEQPVPIYVSAFGPQATELAARIGDGFCTTMPDADLVDAFRQGSSGQLAQILPRPADFEAAMSLVDPQAVGEQFVCGPDVDRHVAAVRAYADAGFDEVFVQQIGPDQAAFFDAWARDVLPQLA